METVLSYKLENFEGPLDLLLQLISKNKLDIYDIRLTVLIDQYLEQMQIFKEQNADIESEFLEMASRLLYLKTVKLLPKHEEYEKHKEEFCTELIEYQTCRELAALLAKNSDGFDKFVKNPSRIDLPKDYRLVHDKQTVFDAYISAVGRGQRRLPPKTDAFAKIVAKKIVSVSSRVVFVMRNLLKTGPKKLSDLYTRSRSRSELVATFLAVLELCKANRVSIDGDGENTEIKLMKGRKNND